MAQRVAFVTGASRGIGKATAVALAEAGFDVAISARSVNEGEPREHSSTVASSNTEPLPGSLSTTAQLIEKAGTRALLVPADLTDPASLGAAATRVLDTWGRVDVMVHNGRYIGPGHMDRFLDTPLDLIRKQIEANVMGTLVLNKFVIPSMISNGGGTIVNITSASGFADPGQPAGDGGWGMGYGVSKGALQRVAGFLKVEHEKDGIRCYNLQPGFIATERMAADMAGFGFVGGEPPEIVGVVVAWLATAPEAVARNGQTVEAQFLCHELGLLPGWDGPKPNASQLNYDLAGANLARLEAELLAKSGAGEGS